MTEGKKKKWIISQPGALLYLNSKILDLNFHTIDNYVLDLMTLQMQVSEEKV